MDSNSLEAKVRILLQKREAELDSETADIIRYIEQGNYVTGMDSVLSKDYVVCRVLQYAAATRRDDSRIKCMTFIAQVMGYMPKDSKSGAGAFAEVAF